MIAGAIGGTVALGLIGGLIGVLLTRSASRFRSSEDSVVDAINRLLPQTQCAQCGYPGCRPYAEAIARGEAINRCPPGGDDTIENLAQLLGRPIEPLDPECGEADENAVAVIREPECIGCTLCIQACPVDAIIGAPQLMHTVIANECTGCELCVAPCPVDCIDMIATHASSTPRPEVPPVLTDCIRCGACEEACPRELAPQALFWFRASSDRLVELDIDRCIECRRCDRVCPSRLPLTDIFSQAKHDVRARRERTARAQHAEARFHRHEARQGARAQRVRQRPARGEAATLLEIVKHD